MPTRGNMRFVGEQQDFVQEGHQVCCASYAYPIRKAAMIARNALKLVGITGLGVGSLVMAGCYGDALDGHPIKHLGSYSEDAERARLNQEAALEAPANQKAVPAGARLSDDQYRVGSPTNFPSVPVGAGGNTA